MNSRERVLTTIRREAPDRVPFNLRPCGPMVDRLRAELGDPQADFAEHFQHDVRYVYLDIPGCPDGYPKEDWTPAPTPESIARCRERTRELQAHGLAVCGGYSCGVFEQAKDWLGDAETLTMPHDDPRRLEGLLDRITQWKMAVYGGYAQAGTDIVWIGDDLGAQSNLIMSPADYRRWYRPRHVQIIQHLRTINPAARIAFHCCGHVTPLVGDLIEIGVDILEAVQAEAMDIAGLKRRFGRDLCFWGGVGAQTLLARTTPQQVVEGVRQTLRTMAGGGGYIAAPCHTLTDEVPWATVLAFHEAMQQYGAYPDPG
jgi:uroporphyrinogen decarboxylase